MTHLVDGARQAWEPLIERHDLVPVDQGTHLASLVVTRGSVVWFCSHWSDVDTWPSVAYGPPARDKSGWKEYLIVDFLLARLGSTPTSGERRSQALVRITDTTTSNVSPAATSASGDASSDCTPPRSQINESSNISRRRLPANFEVSLIGTFTELQRTPLPTTKSGRSRAWIEPHRGRPRDRL
jgi:hypothetical protein